MFLRCFQIRTALIIFAIASVVTGSKDIYSDFLKLLNDPKNVYCKDKTYLLPNCDVCIPGLTNNGDSSNSCSNFISPTIKIRDEIKQLTSSRYPELSQSRPFGLYPFLETPIFLQRHVLFGHELSKDKPKNQNIVDIGAYYSPVLMFLDGSYCPESVVVIEPILDPISVNVPCGKNNFTHVAVLPITFHFFLSVQNLFKKSDAIVCIGCDGHYGPNRKHLENSFQRPYTLYLEFAYDYINNQAYKKMGKGNGEIMRLKKEIKIESNETTFTKRTYRIIRYT